MREHARLRHAVVAALAAVVALLLAPAASWAEDPEVTLSSSSLRVGDQVQVTARGFAPGEAVTVAVCGAADASGRLACAQGVDAVVAADGTLNQALAVGEPAGPCPCTVVVDGLEGPPHTARIDLLGYPVLKKPKAPEVVVDSATLQGSGGIGHWFGLSPEPTLELVLRNAGVSAAQPALDLSWRDGDDEPVAIVDSGVPVIEPGDSVTFSIPLDLGTFAQGEHTVVGQVVVGDLFAPVEARTTVGPWGLYALVLAALVGGAVMRARSVTAGSASPVRSASPAATPQRSRRRAAPARSVSAPRTPAPRTPAPRTPARGAAPAAERPGRPESPQRPAREDRRSRAGREPAYVGPPRLESTPLAPLPSRGDRSPAQDERASTQTMSPLERLSASAPGRTTATATAPGVRVPSQGVAPRVPTREAPPAPAPAPAPEVPAVQAHQDPQQDMATVAQALAVIAERAEEAPARLPDTYAAPAPQPGRRADRGGKRAARPAKGAWITRR
ncbi:hypothetical protein IEQ44_14085 [Nocardioides sp. Y6]|uniref:Neocarzinostatin family protein n=1 Tax=Nocardioides malaquae TaxID=2773426 RepID=A0ABR9RW00_9ACTN|nr:hypothetical protein [Nocardioides malaquae]MBE7325778.1 hypothetical protein [Nocardioides malaquae]